MAKKSIVARVKDAIAPGVQAVPTVLVGESHEYTECPLDAGSIEGHPLVMVGGLQHGRVATSPDGRPIYARRGAPLN